MTPSLSALADLALVACDRPGDPGSFEYVLDADGPEVTHDAPTLTEHVHGVSSLADRLASAPADGADRLDHDRSLPRSPDGAVSGRFQVVASPTDRGLWLDHGPERVFAVIDDQYGDTPELQSGDHVQLHSATVHRDAQRLHAHRDDLSPHTIHIARDQERFLLVDATDLQQVASR